MMVEIELPFNGLQCLLDPMARLPLRWVFFCGDRLAFGHRAEDLPHED